MKYRVFRNTIFYLLIFLVIIGIVSVINTDQNTVEDLNYNQFTEQLEQGNVETFSIKPERDVYLVRGQLVGAEEDEFFETYVLRSEQTSELLAQAQSNLEIQPADETNSWVAIFTSLIPFVIIIILFIFLMSQAQGGGNRVMSFGKSKAKMVSDDKKKLSLRT